MLLQLPNCFFLLLVVTNVLFFSSIQVFKEPDSASAGHPGQQVSESILRFFPGFEAFSLPPPTTDSETMKRLSQEKSQVNHLFLDGIKKFKCLMRRILSPKHSFNGGEFVTGEGGVYVPSIWLRSSVRVHALLTSMILFPKYVLNLQ